MNEQLSEKELEEIKNRCKATTPGPWRASIEGRDHTSASDVILTGDADIAFEISEASPADYDFIAQAKQDVPRLIAEVERLKTLIASR
jgi:hypothetical protein